MIYQVPPGECITMTPEILSAIHKIQLEMLLEIDRICKKHNIKYWLDGGTLLGAVRHQGFVPWDDDVDVLMFREDYTRFCNVCIQELDDSKFFLQTAETDPAYRWTYGKMRRKGTRFVRSGQEHMTAATGVFADVIPMDGRPENDFVDYLQYVVCKYARRVLWSPVGAIQDKSAVKRGLYKMLSQIPKDFVYHVYMNTATRYSPCNSRRITWYSFIDKNHTGYMNKWFHGSVEMLFEGHSFPAPIGAHDVLTYLYGNYMELPPLDQRHGNASASLIELPDKLFE